MEQALRTSLSISAKRQQTIIENCNKNFIKNCSNLCKIIQRTSEIDVKRNFHFNVPSANNWQRSISEKFNLYFLINAIWQTQNRCFPANRYFELRNWSSTKYRKQSFSWKWCKFHVEHSEINYLFMHLRKIWTRNNRWIAHNA